MTTTRRFTVSGVFMAILSILGIVFDVPEFIKQNWEYIPQWLMNPNFLWVSAIAVIYGTFVLIVWLRDQRRKLPAQMQELYDKHEAVKLYVEKLVKKYKFAKRDDLASLDKTTARAFVDECTNKMPRFIGRRLGPKEHEAFTKLLNDVTSDDPREAAGQAALAIGKWCADFLARQLRDTLQWATQSLKFELADFKKSRD